jgi:hypothetical protein
MSLQQFARPTKVARRELSGTAAAAEVSHSVTMQPLAAAAAEGQVRSYGSCVMPLNEHLLS